MRLTKKRRPALMALIVLSAAIAGCVAGGYGYDEYDGVDGGYGVGFYEPYGYYDYGGWDNGYWVGPPRRGGHPGGAASGHGPHPAYRAAAASRSVPSIPSGSRGGGGGSHGGGGGGGHR